MALICAVGAKSVTLETRVWDSSAGGGGSVPERKVRQTSHSVSVPKSSGTRGGDQETRPTSGQEGK